MEIDHLFILASPGAPEADVLEAFGFKEGPARQHAGQGTANRRFFFGNIYLELLYVDDASQLYTPTTQVTRLAERFDASNSDISPFGVCFHQACGAITTLEYQPAYLPKGYKLTLAAETPLTEPMWFFLRTPADIPLPYQRQVFTQAGELNRLTQVTITVAQAAEISTAAAVIMASSCINLVADFSPLMELCFDDGVQGQSHDFRPALPLKLYW